MAYSMNAILVILVLLCVGMLTWRFRSSESLQRYEQEGAFIVVEPRKHEHLAKVIEAYHQILPARWTLYIVHGRRNKAYAKQAAANVEKSGRKVVYAQLNTDNLTAAQYNALFQTNALWDIVNEEHVLVFQTDSMPCGKPLDMERFGKFGYIGCAYGNRVGKNTYWGKHSFYGVGGLSLRRKSFMQQCIQRRAKEDEPEDVAFSNCVDELDFPVPTAADVGDFCAQNTWGDTSKPPSSFGVHRYKSMMKNEAVKREFIRYCPNARWT